MDETSHNDEIAASVLRFMAARAAALPKGIEREEYCSGLRAMFFNWRFLEARLDLEPDEIRAAIRVLESRRDISTDPMFDYGIHVWLKPGVVKAAA